MDVPDWPTDISNNSNVSLNQRYTINLRGATDGKVTFPGNGSMKLIDKDTISITIGRGADEISAGLKREREECEKTGPNAVSTHVVTADRWQLLPLGTFQGIPIASAADFLAQGPL